MAYQINEDIINFICKFLPVPSLKETRLINSLWDRGALTIIKKMCKIPIKFDNVGGGYLDTCKFNESSMENFQSYENIEITFQAIPIPPEELWGSLDLLYAYKEFYRHRLKPEIKWLNIKAFINNEHEAHILRGIFLHFSPTLEELTLELHFPWDYNDFTLGGIDFPNLKKIWETHVMDNNYPIQEKTIELYKELISKSSQPLEHVAMPFLNYPLPVKEEVKINSLSFILHGKNADSFKRMSKHVEKLDINCELVMSKENKLMVVDILSSMKNLLVSLTLSNLGDFGFTERDYEPKFVFPPFPNLRKLTLSFEEEGQPIYFKRGDEELKDNSGIIDYAIYFPKLESLSLSLGMGENVGKFSRFELTFDSFFPHDTLQVCKGLRRLRLPLSYNPEKMCGRSWKIGYTKFLLELFPNAVFKYFEF